jgi:hypothetical protein
MQRKSELTNSRESAGTLRTKSIPKSAFSLVGNSFSSTNLLLQSQKTRTIRELVVVGVLAWVATLVKQLQVARVDGEGLVVGGADEFTVADIVGPGGTTVGLAGEGVALRTSLDSPGAVEAVRGQRAEVATLGSHSLNDHEVLVLALEGVDLHGLEEVVGGVGQDGGGGREVAGEVALRHAGTVDLAVVASEEEVHVLAVADERLVNGTSVGARDGARVQWLSRRPTVDVGRVGAGPVGEGGRSPLVGKDPGALRGEVEEGRCDGVEGSASLSNTAHLGPVAEGSEGHGTILGAGVMVGGVHELLAIVGSNSEVLEVDPAVLGLRKSAAGRPAVGRREGALSCDARGRSQQSDTGRDELHVEWFGVEGKDEREAKCLGCFMRLMLGVDQFLYLPHLSDSRSRTAGYFAPITELTNQSTVDCLEHCRRLRYTRY